ncbi:MAG: Imm8 family immunity protein [Sandaracinaceae bacterium]|nr:hypothetical protein [Myxococcales bacterium]|tara:strand:- start:143 stop:511 length:369 start_codon:yes stop_codon:yes gene_type:complete
MIKNRIRSMSSPDVEIGVWEPESDADVCFLLQIEIGPAGEEGADVFDCMVATPEGLRKLERPGQPVIATRALLVFSSFSWTELFRVLDRLIASCEGHSWVETCDRLQRYFRWEYDEFTWAVA